MAQESESVATPWSVLEAGADHIDSLAWAGVAFYFLARFGPVIGRTLLPQLTKLKVGDLELEFARQTMGAAAKDAIKHNVIATTVKKSSIEITRKDQERAVERAARSVEVLKKKRVLWIDDNIANNRLERKMLHAFGVDIEQVQTNEQAYAALSPLFHGYDLIISDIAREDGVPDGIDFLSTDRSKRGNISVIFYISEVNESLPLPIGAFGLTNRPDELMHLVIDVLERAAD